MATVLPICDLRDYTNRKLLLPKILSNGLPISSRCWHVQTVRGTEFVESRPVVVSLAFDAGLFDDRPPLLDLRLLKRAQRFRRLLIAGRNLLPKAGKPLLDRRFREGSRHSTVEPCNNILRSARWCP